MVLLLRREGTHSSNQGGIILEEMMMTEKGVMEEMMVTEGGQVDWAVQGPQTTRPLLTIPRQTTTTDGRLDLTR